MSLEKESTCNSFVAEVSLSKTVNGLPAVPSPEMFAPDVFTTSDPQLSAVAAGSFTNPPFERNKVSLESESTCNSLVGSASASPKFVMVSPLKLIPLPAK